jgi:UDP-N-acetylglucosamine 1-carboxyvinyltransferase
MIGGSKNSGLIILAASALTSEPIFLHGVPELDDIRSMVAILRSLGGSVERNGNSLHIRMEKLAGSVDYESVRRMRASICLLGALVARKKYVSMPLPGGCVFGPRPIDLHLKGLEKLGCRTELRNGLIDIRGERLRGADIFLGGPHGSTVTGTANVLCAAVLAEGTTHIHCAACEPEVVDLCHFLVKMGARIDGIGTPSLAIDGVGKLHGAEHTLIPDRIQFGTFALLATMVRGNITISPVSAEHSSALFEALDRMGANVEISKNSVRISNGPEKLRAISLATSPYPGFPTDLQAPLCAALTLADGTSTITEQIYPSRLSHVGELSRMGASIEVEEGNIIVRGPKKLSGAPVMASDLRCGASLYLAALAAEGESTIRRVYHVDRGYEHFEEKLRSLGASIERFNE